MLRIFVVGSGGREHALAWKLSQGSTNAQLHAAPGNPGISSVGICHSLQASEIEGLADAVERWQVDLTVVGPEAPLAAGIVDRFRRRGLRIFGPTRLAAEIEWSKAFAKVLMRQHGIPTASFNVCDRPEDARAYVKRVGTPIVIKADGLASGKGVTVARNLEEADRVITDLMVRRVHGVAGARVVIEECLVGHEVSVLALVNGRRVWPLLPAQDYKRVYDGDAGPNTGGMGAIAPAPVPLDLAARLVDEILEPAADALGRVGRPYTGVLYAGVMVTADGPKVLEFNCRLGDPETQALLPLLDSDLAEILLDVLDGRDPMLRWRDGAAACVVLASRGYPGHPDVGRPIGGLTDLPRGATAFHAGTAVRDGVLVNAGGRVLNIVGMGATLDDAVRRAYAGVSRISFEGMHFRRDIGRDVGRSSLVVGRGDVSLSLPGG